MEPGLRSTCDSVRDLAGRLVGAMHSKWGRHCCRPHFHQRVDTLCSHDFRRTFHHVCCGAYLAPDVWPLHVRSGDLLYRDCSPALAPASGFRPCPAASFRSPKSPMAAALRSRLAETVSLYRSGLAAVPDLRPSLSPDPARSRPVRWLSVAPVSNKPTCIWPKPPACRLSTGAWTTATAILGIKTFRTSRPCGFPFRLVCVPKTS
ncbi:hypothetical protein SAMN02745193_02162 [Erythrobacter sanguineus]|uniref:Uncharacterized protein n=1 Tax=Erythrobacter sanguineus TaxID=198312 RepID=A0A1M7SQE8_9SPHN|nr:hypothetical protein SAMN02745193_02162 [Erythrobacter sanguineus]